MSLMGHKMEPDTLTLCSFPAQEATEEPKVAADHCQTDEGEDRGMMPSKPADEQVMKKAEPVERKEEVKVAPLPPRRASTSTPSNMPVRLLTRLGSLDGELNQESRHVMGSYCSVKLRLMLTTPPCLLHRCPCSAGEEVPRHLTQELHASQRTSRLPAESQDVHTNRLPSPWRSAPTAAP